MVTRAALAATAVDVLAADAVILGTPANIGYMSGALKHFFDQVYYPCLSETAGLPYTLYVHGNNDTTGAVRSVETIAKGMSWHRHRPPSPWSATVPRGPGSVLGVGRGHCTGRGWRAASAPPGPGRRGRASPIPTGARGTDTAMSAVDPPQEMPPVHNVPGHRLVDRR